MDLQIYGKNVEITDAIRNYVEKKTAKLARYLKNIDDIKVEITKEKTRSPEDRFTVQITVRNKGDILRAEEKTQNINLAVDSTIDALTSQISRYKGKFDKKGMADVPPAKKATVEEQPSISSYGMPELARVKRFKLNSISVRQAAEQMELLSHDFLLFFNAENEALNLIYRRKDGNYGLIVPEIDEE